MEYKIRKSDEYKPIYILLNKSGVDTENVKAIVHTPNGETEDGDMLGTIALLYKGGKYNRKLITYTKRLLSEMTLSLINQIMNKEVQEKYRELEKEYFAIKGHGTNSNILSPKYLAMVETLMNVSRREKFIKHHKQKNSYVVRNDKTPYYLFEEQVYHYGHSTANRELYSPIFGRGNSDTLYIELLDDSFDVEGYIAKEINYIREIALTKAIAQAKERYNPNKINIWSDLIVRDISEIIKLSKEAENKEITDKEAIELFYKLQRFTN